MSNIPQPLPGPELALGHLVGHVVEERPAGRSLRTSTRTEIGACCLNFRARKRGFNVDRVLVLNTPPALRTAGRSEKIRCIFSLVREHVTVSVRPSRVPQEKGPLRPSTRTEIGA